MPYKDKEAHAQYMKEYRKNQKLKNNKIVNRKPKEIKNQIMSKSINESNNKITQEEKDFLKNIIIRMNKRRYINEETTKTALDILYK